MAFMNSPIWFVLRILGIAMALHAANAETIEPKLDVPVSNITVIKGNTAILPCSVKFLGRHKVVWTDQWSTLLTYEDRRIIDDDRKSVERPFTKDWNLHIRNVKHGDQGTYFCQVNTSPVKVKTVNLKVLEQPTIRELPHDIAVNEGETVELKCKAVGDPEPTITWKKQEGQILNGRARQLNDGTLRIENVSAKDDGQYICVAENLAGTKEATGRLTVYAPPSFLMKPMDQVVRLGRNVKIQCVVTGNPAPTVFWRKRTEQQLMFPNQEYGRFSVAENGTFRIERVQLDDEGEYTCQALNAMGSADATALIDVRPDSNKEAPRIQISGEGYLKKGQKLKLTCNVSIIDESLDGLYWFKDGNKLTTQGEKRIQVFSAVTFSDTANGHMTIVLEITNTTSSDSGDYVCKSAAHSQVAGVRVVVSNDAVTYEPSFDVSMSNVTVKEGTTAILPCSVKFLGHHQVVWSDQWSTLLTFEDRRIVNDERLSIERPYTTDWNLHIRTVRYNDQGIYNCQVNTSPVTMKTVNLKVQVPSGILDNMSSGDITAREGENVTLVCNVTGIPMPNVTWHRYKNLGEEVEQEGEFCPGTNRIGVSGEVLIIHNVSRYCDGSYECVAFNGVPPAVHRKIKVAVEFNDVRKVEPTFDAPVTNVTATRGSTVILPCSVTHLGNYKVIWLNNLEKLLTFEDRRIISDERISLERPYVKDWNLHIRNVKQSDQGIYTCQVNTDQRNLKQVNLKVQVPPEIIEHSSTDVRAREGDTVKLVCNVTGVPKPTVTWHFKSDWQKDEYTTVSNGEVMIINNVTRYNHGSYKCVTTNGIPPASQLTFRVYVEYAPEITIPNTRIGQALGKTTILECIITASPYPVSTWKRNGQELMTGWKYNIELYEDGPKTFTLSLRIKNLERENYGKYTCESANIVGRSTSVVTLFEYGTNEPTLGASASNVTVREGFPIILPCSIQNLGQYKIAWTDMWSTLITFMHTRITDDERFSLQRPHTTDWNLHIRDVKYSDQGLYTCQVNTKPVKTKKVYLKVQVPPKIVHEYSSTNVTVNEGETVTLFCNVTGAPMPNVTWHFNKILSKEGGKFRTNNTGLEGEVMVMKNISRINDGKYYCVASNGVPPDAHRSTWVTVNYAPEVRIPHGRIGQRIRKETILECIITARPFGASSWKRNGRQLTQRAKYRIEIYREGARKIVLSLRITNLQKADFGKYTCEAQNSIGRSSTAVKLYEIQTVEFESTPITVTAQVGTVAILPCSLRNRRWHKVYWRNQQSKLLTRHERRLISDDRFNVERPSGKEWNLHIRNVTLSDQGEYQCSVNTKPAMVKTVSLVIQVISKGQTFEVEPQDTVVIKGGTALLHCKVSNKVGEVQWTKDDFGIGYSFPRYRIIGNGSKDGQTEDYSLMITDVKLEDEANYQCQVSTTQQHKGIRSRIAHLSVITPPDLPVIEGGITRLSVMEGVPQNISCRANNSKPPAAITWYMNNRRLTEMIDHRILPVARPDHTRSDSVSTITIVVSEADDGHQIECRAQNEAMVEPLSVKATLDVKSVSKQQRFVIEPEDVDVIKGGTAQLHCKVANKSGILLWTKNTFVLGIEKTLSGFPRYQIVSGDHVMGSEAIGDYILKISDVRFEDEAEYGCELTATEQVNGIRSRKARLSVIVPPAQLQMEGATTGLTVTAGQPQNISCRATYGKPAAEITWYMNNRPLTQMINYKILQNPNDKRVDAVSTITIVVSKAGDGYQIECRAQNKAMIEPLIVMAKLDVRYNKDSLKQDIAETLRCRKNPGLAVTVVKDGEVILAEGFGVADINKDIPVTNRTLFGIASLSKAFAATLLLKLVSRTENISLHTKVGDILGDDFGFSDEFRTKHTTLEDILSHRTGLPGNNAIRFDTNLTRANLPRRIKHMKATGTWRGSYIYNNLMYGVVTRVAEVLGGASWEELVQKELYDPLEMRSSSFATKMDFSSDQVSKPYRFKDDKVLPVSVDFSRRWALLCGSGCVMTNALDAGNWMKFHLSKGLGPSGERVMEEGVTKQLYVPRTAMQSYNLKYYSKPDVPVTTSFGMYAFGWRIGYYRGYKMIVHSGSTYGYRALLTLLPTENLGIFIAMTGDDPSYQYRFALQNYVADIILGEKPWLNISTICSYPQPWFEPKASSSNFKASKSLSRDPDEYEGVYHNTPYGNLEIYYNATEGQLMAQYGFARFLLHQQKGDNFYGEGFGINDVKDCSSMTFLKRDDSEKYIDVKVAGFEPATPPTFVRLGYSSPGV